MTETQIDAGATAAFCQAVARVFTEIHRAQSTDIQEALAACLADGGELFLEVGAVSGSFTAAVDIGGRRTTILEAQLRPGKEL